MKITKIYEFNSCIRKCPHYTTEMGGVMACSHPKAPDYGYIITREEGTNGFPTDCPLKKENTK